MNTKSISHKRLSRSTVRHLPGGCMMSSKNVLKQEPTDCPSVEGEKDSGEPNYATLQDTAWVNLGWKEV